MNQAEAAQIRQQVAKLLPEAVTKKEKPVEVGKRVVDLLEALEKVPPALAGLIELYAGTEAAPEEGKTLQDLLDFIVGKAKEIGVEFPGGLTPERLELAVVGKAGGEGEPEKGGADRGGNGAEDLSLDLDDFFSEMSDSLISAADRLDRSSLDRLASRRPGVPPALYYIPRLQAEIKAAFRKGERTRLGILLASRSRELEEMRESTVTLEIAAVPPAPGEERPGRYREPIPDFLVEDALPEGGDRQALLERLEVILGRALEQGGGEPEGAGTDPVTGRPFRFRVVNKLPGATQEAFRQELEAVRGQPEGLLVYRLLGAEEEAGGKRASLLVHSPDGSQKFGFYELTAHPEEPTAPGKGELWELVLRSSHTKESLPMELFSRLDATVRSWPRRQRAGLRLTSS